MGNVTFAVSKSTESITVPDDFSGPEISSKLGPSLPEERYGHCFIKTNSETAFIIGGMNGEGFRTTTVLQYNIPEKEFEVTNNPMLYTRYQHVCGTLVDADRKEYVIVAGGKYRTSEVFLSFILTLRKSLDSEQAAKKVKTFSVLGPETRRLEVRTNLAPPNHSRFSCNFRTWDDDHCWRL